MDEPILILSGKSRASSAESIGHSTSRCDALSCDGSQSVRSWEPKNTTLGETSSCVGTTGIWDPRVKATLPSLVHWTLWGNWSSSAVPSVTENLCLPEWHLGQDIATHHLFYSSLAAGHGNGELLHNEKKLFLPIPSEFLGCIFNSRNQLFHGLAKRKKKTY